MCAIRPTSAHRAVDTPPILLQCCKFYCSCNRGLTGTGRKKEVAIL